MSLCIAGRELPPLPTVLGHEVILGLLKTLDEGEPDEQCFAAHQLAALLEAEEAKYRAVVGDPHANPSLRNHYAVGKILAFIKEEEDVYDKICDVWVQSRNATLEQQVAGLRLLLATLECWLFQYPLTEESLVERLGEWSVAGLDKAPLPGEGPPAGRQELLEEARQAYALGVLSIALTNEEYADEAVRTPLVPAACRYLRRAVAAMGSTPSGGDGGGPAAEAEGEEVSRLRHQRLLAALRCLMCTGEYVESLGPFLQFCGVDTVCALLRHIRAAAAVGGAGASGPAAQRHGWLMHEALQVVCSLLAHRKFAELLVEAGGVQLLLALPRNQHSYPGLSLSLFGLAALPLAFERACALPAPAPRDMVAAALSLLASGSDVARKNGALFLDHAISTRVICHEFDSQEGLHRLMFPLRRLLALTREGGGMHPDVRTERQVAYHSARALLQYARAHLGLQLEALRRRLAPRQPPAQPPAPPPPHKPIDTGAAATADAAAALTSDGRLAEAFARERWPLVGALEAQGGVQLLLELVHLATPEDRYAREMSLHALETLQLLTLHPAPRAAVIAAAISPHRTGMAVLLHAAGTGHAGPPFYGLADPEVIATALHVIVNCVTAPPSLAYLLPPPDGTGPSGAARQRAAAAAAPPAPQDTPAAGAAPAAAPAPAQQAAGAPRPGARCDGTTAAACASAAPPSTGKPAAEESRSSVPAISPRRPDASEPAPPSLELGPSAVGGAAAPPTLGDALEAGYAAARQAVRGANGIRVLLSLLQSRQHFAAAAADRTRALTVGALLGLARDAPIRHILNRLQVGKQLAELVREPAAAGAGGGAHRSRGAQEPVDAQGVAQGSFASSGAPSWHERFNRDALELIALTTAAGGAGRSDRVTAAATDAAAPALLKIERAAVAAATHIAFPPQELLLLIYEHLKASGLHTAAAALAREASLERQAVTAVGGGGGAGGAGGGGGGATPAPAARGDVGGGPAGLAGRGEPPTGGKDKRRSITLAPSLLQHIAQQKQAAAQQQVAQHQGGGGSGAASGSEPDASGSGREASQHAQSQQQRIGAHQRQHSGSSEAASAAAAEAGAQAPATPAAAAAAAAAAFTSTNLSNSKPAPQHQQQHAPPAAAHDAVPATPVAGFKRKASPAGLDAQPDGKRPHQDPTLLPPGSSAAAAAAAADGAAAAGPSPAPRAAPVALTPPPVGAAAAAAPPAGAMSPPAAPLSSGAPGAKRAPRLRVLAAPGPDGAPWGAPPQQHHNQQAQPLGSDAEYLAALQRQQQKQQQLQQQQLLLPPDPPLFHSPLQHGGRAGMRSPLLASAPSPGGAGASPFAGAGGALQDAAAAGAGAGGVNPYLANLPSRRGGLAGAGRRNSAGADFPQRLTPLAEAAPEPRQVPPHVGAAARDVMTGPIINSRLGAIVLSHLKQQHRAACLASPNPISTLPPVSLLRPYALPLARRELEAPRSVAARVARREAFGGRGGRGGATLDRRLVYSRFRPGHVLRDEGSLLTAAAFARGYEVLVVGCSGGELRVHDAYSGEGADEVADAHSGPVVMLQTHEPPGSAGEDLLLLSSSRHEVKLWRGADLAAGHAHEFAGLTRARFNPAGTQIVGVSSLPPRRALIYDVATGTQLAALDDAAAALARGGGHPGGDRGRGAAAACFGPTGELLLWGTTLWDPRVPVAVHTFDQLSEHQAAGSAFHPGGLELILNSEVWDLRTYKLMRSVPCLDATSITFNSAGDVIFARLRRPSDDSLAALLHPRRRRHPLATAFRTVDARSYSEIATVDVERAVLDLALDPTDSYLAVVAVDIAADTTAVSSSVRMFEVGRPRPAQDDESDEADDAEDEDDEEADEGEDGDESAEEERALEDLLFGPGGDAGGDAGGGGGAEGGGGRDGDGGGGSDGEDGGSGGGGGGAALAAVFRQLQEMGGGAEVEVELDLSDADEFEDSDDELSAGDGLGGDLLEDLDADEDEGLGSDDDGDGDGGSDDDDEEDGDEEDEDMEGGASGSEEGDEGGGGGGGGIGGAQADGGGLPRLRQRGAGA